MWLPFPVPLCWSILFPQYHTNGRCYYHTGILVLLRPWMFCNPSLQLPESAHTVCTLSAQTITRTLQRYRELYTLRRIVNTAVHVVYMATTIHLADIAAGKPEAWSMAETSFSLLRAMRDCWPAAGCHLRILGAMAHKWELGIPEDWFAGMHVPQQAESMGFESLRMWLRQSLLKCSGLRAYVADLSDAREFHDGYGFTLQ